GGGVRMDDAQRLCGLRGHAEILGLAWRHMASGTGTELRRQRPQAREGKKLIQSPKRDQDKRLSPKMWSPTPGTNLIHEHKASVRKRSPRPAARPRIPGLAPSSLALWGGAAAWGPDTAPWGHSPDLPVWR